MARKIKQYRYYDKDSVKNQPEGINESNLTNGSVFNNFPIIQLGIQTLPGTKFYLNNSREPIIIGYTGIFELNLENQIDIIQIKFDKSSITNIGKNPNGYLIIDILYEEEEAEV